MADSQGCNAGKGGTTASTTTPNPALANVVVGGGGNANLDSHNSDDTNTASPTATSPTASIPPVETTPGSPLPLPTAEHHLGVGQQLTIPTPQIYPTNPIKTEKVDAPLAAAATSATPAAQPIPAAGDAPAAGCDTVFVPHPEASFLAADVKISAPERPLTPPIYRACREAEAAAAAEDAAEAAFLDRVTAFPGIALPSLTVDTRREKSLRKRDNNNDNDDNSNDNDNSSKNSRTMSRSVIERKPSLTSVTKMVSTPSKSKKDRDADILMDRWVRGNTSVFSDTIIR